MKDTMPRLASPIYLTAMSLLAFQREVTRVTWRNDLKEGEQILHASNFPPRSETRTVSQVRALGRSKAWASGGERFGIVAARPSLEQPGSHICLVRAHLPRSLHLPFRAFSKLFMCFCLVLGLACVKCVFCT